MKDRTWLIRTKQNKILGPLSKQKVIDLVQTESLTGEDEVCSGNGYWFWIKEKELVDKYLLGESEQSFNPVCEAQTLFDLNPPVADELKQPATSVEEVHIDLSGIETSGPSNKEFKYSDDADEDSEHTTLEEVLFPEEDDLDYPDMEAIIESTVIDPETVIKPKTSAPLSIKSDTDISFELNSLVDEAQDDSQPEEVILPEQDDLEYPDLVIVEKETQKIEQNITNESQEDIKAILKAEMEALKEDEEVLQLPVEASEDAQEQLAPVREMPRPSENEQPLKKKRRRKKKRKATAPPAPPKRNDRVIVYLLGLVVAVIFYGVFYYYTEVLGKSLFGKALEIVMPPAYAQDVVNPEKKKFN